VLVAKEEMARIARAKPCCRRAELAGLLRTAGSLHLTGGGEGLAYRLEVATGSGAVARAAFRLLHEVFKVRPEIVVAERPSQRGLRVRSYRVAVEEKAGEIARLAGLLSEEGNPSGGVRASLVARNCCAMAYVGGAFLGRGSISDPKRSAHLEIGVPDEQTARDLEGILCRQGWRAGAGAHRGEWRVYLKSAGEIGDLLGRMGAGQAYLAWEESRVRREVRLDTIRLANADQANVRREVKASLRQTALARAVLELPPGTLPEGLREVALARVANPEASLAELGRLCAPPLSKAGAHRRFTRLEALLSAGAPKARSGEEAPGRGRM